MLLHVVRSGSESKERGVVLGNCLADDLVPLGSLFRTVHHRFWCGGRRPRGMSKEPRKTRICGTLVERQAEASRNLFQRDMGYLVVNQLGFLKPFSGWKERSPLGYSVYCIIEEVGETIESSSPLRLVSDRKTRLGLTSPIWFTVVGRLIPLHVILIQVVFPAIPACDISTISTGVGRITSFS